jgi:hypothetical protein
LETLAAQVARQGPLNERDAVGWAIRLCKRVDELHRVGVAHGGISADVLFTEGTTCNSAGMLGDVREAAIRPNYHSPERIAGHGLSPADDTWAVGVTLYYLLTANLPFAGVTAAEIRERLESAAPAPLAVFDVGDDDLQRILDRFLERNIAQRTIGIAALRGSLEAWYPEGEAARLPPLEDGDDSLAGHEDDEDDDEESVQTVMRDFSEVRAQLRKLQEDKGPSLGGTSPVPLDSPFAQPHQPAPWAGAGDARHRTAIGGFSRDMLPPRPAAGAPAPRPAAGAPPPVAAPRPTAQQPAYPQHPAYGAPAAHPPGAHPPGVHPPGVHQPGAHQPGAGPQTVRGPGMLERRAAATVPQPAASGRGLAPPRGSGPGTQPPAPIAAARADDPLGGFQQSGAFQQSGGFPAAPPPAPSGSGLRPASQLAPYAPPGRPPVFGLEDDDSDERVATVMMEAGSADLSAAIAEALATEPLKATSVWPEMAPAGPAGAPGPPPAIETPVASGPMATEPTVDDFLGPPPPATAPGGPYVQPIPATGTAPVYPASVRMTRGSGLKTALIVAVVVLVMVMAAVVALWLDRSGVIDLNLPGNEPPAPSGTPL